MTVFKNVKILLKLMKSFLQWRSYVRGQGGQSARVPLTEKKMPTIRGKEGRNWEGSFTLPLLADTAGYATILENNTIYVMTHIKLLLFAKKKSKSRGLFFLTHPI